jgi:hypothetical protein
MKDSTILDLAGTTATLLKRMEFHESADKVAPSYNALLGAAKENHPENPFLSSLEPVDGKINKNQLQILFTQLRIVVEATLETDE